MGELKWAENAIERALVKNLPGRNQSAKYIRAKSRESFRDKTLPFCRGAPADP